MLCHLKGKHAVPPENEICQVVGVGLNPVVSRPQLHTLKLAGASGSFLKCPVVPHQKGRIVKFASQLYYGLNYYPIPSVKAPKNAFTANPG